MYFYFHTLGCKVNQYESQEMRELVRKSGYDITEDESKADVFVINSCTVTSESDRKSRQQVRHYKNLNPNAIVVLTGCMPQSFPDMAKDLIEADIVLGNKSNRLLVSSVDDYIKHGNRLFLASEHNEGDSLISSGITRFDERTRADLKIEDGCDRYCTYCIIPKARGHVRFKSIDDIKAEVNCLAQNGYREIVLVGINLSAYGKATDLDLADAVYAAAENPQILRVRLGSLEPDHITDELLLRLKACPKLCPQFHISLQSGCDKILKLMNRHYKADEYKLLCDKLRSHFPDCTITTDIMVGFVGENEEDFNETLDFVKQIQFEKVHVFPYSRRKGTAADKMSGHLENSIKADRAHRLSTIADSIRQNYLKGQEGKTMNVLTEAKGKDGFSFGYSDNYTPVIFKADAKVGEIVKIKITGVKDDSCIGVICR